MRITAYLFLAAFTAVVGCTETKPETDPRDSALQDPMNYNPAAERRDISGGGITEFDKGAFRKDLDNVLSP